MKKLLLILLIALVTTSCYTPKLVTFSDDEFVKVYDDLSGASKDELFLKSQNWLVGIFKDAKSVVQHSDKAAGVILGKYMLKTVSSAVGLYGTVITTDVYAVIDIRIKDGKVRLKISPYDYSYVDLYSYPKEDAIRDIENLAESFHSALKAPKVNF